MKQKKLNKLLEKVRFLDEENDDLRLDRFFLVKRLDELEKQLTETEEKLQEEKEKNAKKAIEKTIG